MDDQLVSIIIVNWNGKKYLNECITSLLNQTYSNIEIILVDNASIDGSVEFVRGKFPVVSVIQNEKNLGFAEGNNIGFARAKGELIALFNQDAIADKNWLAILVNEINKSEKIAAVSGKVYYWGDKYGKNAVFCTWPKIDPYTGIPYNFNDDELRSKVDYLSGCAMLVKKKVIDEIGMLDTGYFMYFDETDWCARMIRAGYDLIYIPSAAVKHVVSASLGDSEVKLYYMSRNRIRFVLKNFDAVYILFFSMFFAFETLFEFIEGRTKKNLQRSRIRQRAVYWNLINIFRTFKARKESFSSIESKISYNRSLPLRSHHITEERFDINIFKCIFIEPCNICHLRCPYCPTGMGLKLRDTPKGMLHLDTLKAICSKSLKDYHGQIGLYNWGEPFLNTELPRIVRYLKENTKSQLIINSNFSFRNDDLLKEVLHYFNGDVIIISCDGFSQETCEKYRKNVNFENVMHNIQLMVDNLPPNTKLIWQYLEFPWSLSEIKDAKTYCEEKNIQFYVGKGGISPDYPMLPTPSSSDINKIRCDFFLKSLVINFDGEVYPCCAFYGPKEYSIGNAGIFDLKKIFTKYRGKEMMDYLYYKTNGNKNIFCKLCIERNSEELKSWKI